MDSYVEAKYLKKMTPEKTDHHTCVLGGSSAQKSFGLEAFVAQLFLEEYMYIEA